MIKKDSFKYLIFLVLLVFLIGAASAAEDVSVDDLSTDAVAVDAIAQDASDIASVDTVSVSNDIQTNSSQELLGETDVEQGTGSADAGFEPNKAASKSADALKDGESATTVYVATTGSDENDGLSNATAVATIAKAIEIVNATAGTDFTVLVSNGVYNVTKIESPAAKNVNLIGESKEGTIVGGSGIYAINVYQDEVNWTIENFTFCDLNSTSSASAFLRCFAADSTFLVNDCIFRNIGSKNGAIYITSTGTRRISNCLFEDNFGTYSSTSSVIHLYGEGQVTLDNIEIKGSYQDPSVGTATYLRSILYADQSQTNVVLMNSRIHDNNGSIGSIIEAKGTFKVINTTIENNYINYSANGVNGGTYMFYSGTSSSSASNINITQSVIKDNIIAGGSIGLFNVVYGSHNIDHNVIMNNKYANGNDVPLGSFSGGSITTDDNYWGTNERPNTKTSQWVILTADVPEYVFVGLAESIPVYLNTYNNTAGETGDIAGMPDVTLDLSYALNEANPTSLTISNGQGAIDYTAAIDGDETITLSSGDAFSFEVNADVSTLIYVDGSVETSGTGTSESPFKTIAEALNIAADGKIIVIRSGTYEESDLVIDDAITVKSDKNANVIIDAGSEGRGFTVTSTATLRDLSLTGGMANDASGIGGAIFVNGGNLTLNNVNITESYATSGGAIGTSADSVLTVSNSAFSENSAMNGGAIYVAGEASISGSEFTDHEYGYYGAAIYVNSSSPVSISSNTFTGNDATKGDALYIESGTPSLSGNTMGDETIYLAGGSLKTILTFIGGSTVNADFGETVDLTATLTSEDGNTVKGGIVTFTANGETIETIDLSSASTLQTTYTVPNDATGDITISGSYSLDSEGTVVSGILHPAISYWFIEGAGGYETLSQAIDAASAGDVIYYDLPDDYTEVINGKTLNKAVTIKNNGTGTVTLDANKSKVFTVSDNVELNNLNFINGANAVGGFISQSSSNLNIIDCSFKDVSSTSNGAAISSSYGNLNIDGCIFENITGKQGVIYYSGTTGNLKINNSAFNNITGSYDGWVVSTGAHTNIENTNFTNLVSTQATSTSYYGAVYATTEMNISGCLFKNITGPTGAAIYSTADLKVTRSVFDGINTTISAIYASSYNSDINYNIFINNENINKIFSQSSGINANYNFWGSNDKPSTSLVSSSLYKNWTIVELSTATEEVYVGTTADIAVQFVGTDGTENLTLDDVMPEYSFDLSTTAGSLDATEVTLVDNEATVTFTPPATEGSVTITATPGPAELVIAVSDPAALLVVSTDGDDETGAGTLDNPYATIEHALSQVTETRNIIYILNTGEDYCESDLTVAGNVIIRGEDNTVTIDAENDGRIFIVTGTLSLEDISLTGAMSNGVGGAILVNGGNLTVTNAIISDCGAASGGAIGTTAGSNLTVSDSTFDGNIGSYGGAIYVGGEASISDSEFVDHEYAIYGGAIYVNTTDDVAITGNSFDGNDADKGEAIYIENGAVSLSENTMVDVETIFIKGGSVNGILIFLANTTVNADFGETVDLTATLTDDMGNPIVGGNVVFTANGETVATVENSGSSLQTTYTVPTDASGDILISGSFSLGDGMVVATGVLHPAISYWFIEGGSGYETLAQAIAAAQAGDVIYGLPGTYDISGLTVNKAVTIKANESGSIILNGKGNQILRTSANVILENLTFINGSATDNGGLIYISSNSLVINNSVLKDTQATGGQGAAIYVASGASNVVIENSAFDNINTTAAAVINCRSSSSVFTVVKSNFTNMDITTNGVFYFYEGGINAIESQFINITGGDGAAIYFYGINNNNVTKCLFDNVTTTRTSGIIYSNSKSANVSYNVFLGINKGMYSSSSYSGVITADYNYWGTNDNPSDYVNSNTKLNNWVIMTVTPDAVDSIAPGDTQAFTVDFTHYTDGTANYTMADTIPELTVSGTALIGTLDQNEIETVAGQAVFTYTAGSTGEETVTFTNNDVSIPVSFVVGDGYFGIVYVAKDGSDDNRGDEENPVASIAKAIEIAKAGSGQIIINEGTYSEYNLTIDSDLEISTVGDVIWDATGGRAFAMTAGNVSIANITFINGNSSYAGQLISVTGGSLAIDGSKFTNNGGPANTSGVIRVQDADLDLSNCVIDNNEGGLGNSYGFIYSSGATLKVDNCNFTNNLFKYGPIYISGGSIAVINNTEFISNTARATSGGSGGALYIGASANNPTYALIQNSKFIDNSATGSSYYPGQGGAIYFNNNVDATIVNCVFENNTCANNTDGTVIGSGGAIMASGCNITVVGSVFDSNIAGNGSAINLKYNRYAGSIGFLNISNSIILGADDTQVIASDNENGTFIANSNWWGTNSNPSDKVSEFVTVDNWVIMNVSPTETTGFTGEPVEITVDFKYTNSTAGTIETLSGTLPQELTVNAYATNGTLDKTTAIIDNLQVKFAFTPEFDGANVVAIYTDINNIVPVIIMVNEKYAGPIYVSKDGDDANEGSEDLPVATIAKAIELAQGKSGQIFINEGTYVESNLTISNDLNINAIGEVIWDANGQRAFSMATGDVNITNVTFINGNSTSYGHLIRVDGNSISFDDCKFISNGGSVTGTNGIIYVNLASAKFNNCLFENNTAGTGTSYGIISLKDSILAVDGCTFVNNFNKNGCIYVSGSNIGSVAIINNTKFIGNNATSASGGSGGAIYASGSMAYQYSNGTVRPGAQSIVYVVDCEFINNTAFGGTYYNAEGGAIFANANSTIYISDSEFINNSAVDHAAGKVGRGGAIAATTGNLQITNCIFESNTATNGSTISMKFANNVLDTLNVLNISNSVIIGDNSAKLIQSDYTNGSLIANNNWWHANENPSDRVSEGITVDSWVILTADPSEVTGTLDEILPITANFRHTNSTDGTIGELEGAFPELEVYGMAYDGEITESNMTVDNVATLYYTPEEVGETTVYAVTGNAMVPIKVTITNTPQPADIIYVAPSGNDGNDGTYDNPVATIAHAVELASAEGAAGVVVIEAGLYNENNIVINSAHPISITGNGTVIIRGNNHAVNGNGAGLVLGEVTDGKSIMIVNTTEAVEIKNIQFEDNKAENGGAILINADTSRNLKDVNVTIGNCTFTNLEARYGGAILGTYLNGTVSIKDCNFTANTASSWGGAVTMSYSAYDNDCLKFEVVNCNFENNTANNGGALYLMAQDITIKDSVIANNNATYHPGALYLQNCTAVIDNCVISNNSGKYDKAAIAIHGATIDYQTREVNPANVVITNCIIENNTGRDRTAPAIYLENSRLNMSYSSVVNDMNINNTVTATYGDEQPGNIIINNNWWGTNDPSETIFGTNITMDNWVIMNVVSNATEAVAGDEVKVTVDFNHVNTTAGEIEELTGGVIPRDSYTVALSVDNGTIAPETMTIENGASGEAVFTAANGNALITVTSEKAVETLLILVGDQPVPYTGIVYVSKDGDDGNEGSEDEPVATIARAIEIATAEDGSGQIVIKEGTYNEVGFNITKDLTITGEGSVIIDAGIPENVRLFNIDRGSGVSNFEIHNLVLENLYAMYGAAVYSYANNLVLDNITITGVNKEMARLITSNSNLTVKDSVFANNTVSGIITEAGNNNVLIINTTFEGNNVTYDQSIFGVVSVSSGKGNLTIEDSKFYDNLVRQSTVAGYTETNIAVKGTEFINNTANNLPYYSYGGAIRAQAQLDVTESIFINNSARRDGGAIYVGPNAVATITKSAFINNTLYDNEYYGDAIYTKGTTTVNYCIFLTNGTRYVIYNDGSNEANAQYNWWGTNDNPQGKASSADVSNWIVMNVNDGEFDYDDAEEGEIITFNVDFNHYVDANGDIQELPDSLAQELLVEFISDAGTFDNLAVSTVDQVATASYTIAEGNNALTVKSTDAIWTKEFSTIEKAIANMDVEIYDDEIEVTLTDEEGIPIEGKTINLIIGEDTLTGTTDDEGIASIDISDLDEGSYKATISLDDHDYAADDLTAFILVKSDELEVPVGANIILVLCENGTSIEVTLTDIEGEPIGNVEVIVYTSEDDDGTVVALNEEGEGIFDFDNTQNQSFEFTYTVVDEDEDITWSSYYEYVVNAEEVPVVADVVIELSYEDGALVAYVTDLEGNPLADKEIVVEINEEILEDTVTDEDGYWTGALLGDSIVFVSCVDEDGNLAQATLVYVANDEPVLAGANIILVLAENGTSIEVALTDIEGNPIGDAEVIVYINDDDGTVVALNEEGEGVFDIDTSKNQSIEVSYTLVLDEETEATYSAFYDYVFETEEVPVVADGELSVETTDDAVVATLVDSEGNPIANATITAVVDGEEQNFTTDENGKVSVPVGENADVELSYTDPENGATVKYATKLVTKEVPVTANGTISVETTDDAVEATLVDSEGKPIANATIAAIVDGEEQNLTTDENGKVTVPVSENADVELSYTDENGATVTYTTKVVTKEVPVEVPVTANGTLSVETEDGSSVSVTVKDLDGNAIANASLEATVNGEKSTITTDADGKATIAVSGNSTVELVYTDPENNATVSASLTVVENVVEKIIEVIPNRTATQIIYKDMNTSSVVVGVDGRIGEYFYATLKDSAGKALANKSVAIGFNGKVYNRTTDENGTVKLQINLKAEGRYTFAIAFLGDDEYNGTFEVALITVKAQTPKLTVPAKTYKATAKTKTLTATLTSAKGNPISGRKVTFTVNGKTYTGTTNSKGVVSVKVSLTKKGTYSFTVKSAKTDAYAAVTKTAKLTIK